MKQNVFYREEESIVCCPRCNKATRLRYAVDKPATVERTATMKAQGFDQPDQLLVYSTTPYLLICSVCPFQMVLAHSRRRKLTHVQHVGEVQQ